MTLVQLEVAWLSLVEMSLVQFVLFELSLVESVLFRLSWFSSHLFSWQGTFKHKSLNAAKTTPKPMGAETNLRSGEALASPPQVTEGWFLI